MVDIFEAVENLGDNLQQKGDIDGKAEGQRRQYKEGYTKGWQQACHLLQEIGTLHGIVSSAIQNRTITNPPEARSLDKVYKSLNKLLLQLKDHNLWLALGSESEEKLAVILTSLHAKVRFNLRKLNIPTTTLDKAVDSEF